MANEIYRNYDFQLEANQVPTALILPAEQEAVVGSLVKLDGRASVDPEQKGLTFKWRFAQVPIGSQVERFGFSSLEDDDSIVTFAPDVTGPYSIELIVSDGSLDSDPALATIDVRIILVPYHKGLVPDASFIWNYLSDFWTKVDGKQKLEVFWSSAIQIAAAEILKLYQFDYNKSIQDIQEVFQRRWLSYSPSLVFNRNDVRFVLADDQAGSQASTFTFDPDTGIPEAEQPGYTSQVGIPFAEGNLSRTPYGQKIYNGRVLKLGGRTFTMSRVGDFSVSLNSEDDGKVNASTNVFNGSGFLDDWIGYTLRVLGNIDGVSGDWIIIGVTSSVEITLSKKNGDPVVFSSTVTDLEYTVLPPTSSHNSFVTSNSVIPAGLDSQVWRFSSTLVSTEHNYEAEGVSPGDTLEIELIRLDIGLTATFFAQVVSVDENRLGFVLNLSDLVDGQKAGGLTSDIQITLAADLQVSGLSAAIDGSLIYIDEAALINATINSTQFKRTYFETELSPFTDIDVGAFKVRARPVQIFRNKRMPVDPKLVSVPILQEYVKQPTVVVNEGKTYLVTAGGQREVSREPFVLAENLDYVVDDESTITGSCDLEAGIDEIKVPFGDFIDRSIQEQDVLEITVGFTTQKYEIRRILGPELVRVYPTPNNTTTGAPFIVNRRIEGKFIRFIDGKFTKTRPSPKRLWAEVSYFDNNEAVENNFGVLVGLTREDLERSNAEAPYKSAVAGLMYALTNGPTISNLTLAGQILLGLPFTQAAGVIKEINPEYRKREDGSTRFGRLLIEGRDSNNNPTGLTYIYLYPQGRQLFDELTQTWISALDRFSGLSINPDTGVEFAVGDSVGQFVPLSKGIEIQEYLATPEWSAQLLSQGNIQAFLRQYHSFQLVVNSDLVSASDIDLAAQFLRKAKAHYIKLLAALLKSIEEIITIQDALIFGRLMQFFDITGQGIPSAMKYDLADEDRSVIRIDGTYCSRYISGIDLVTTKDSLAVSSASGGFINPRPVYSESWDPPLLRPGDILAIDPEAINGGYYVVASVTSDTELIVEPGQNFETKTGQSFVVYRPIRNPVWSGKVSVTTGDGVVSTQEVVGVQGGIGSAGVAVGDMLVFTDLATMNPVVSYVYTIVRVVIDPVSPFIVVVPDPVELSGVYDAWVIRESLMTNGSVVPYGSTSPTFWADYDPSFDTIQFNDSGSHINNWLNISLLQYGDKIVIENVPHFVHRFNPENRTASISPRVTSSAIDQPVSLILHPDRGTIPVSVDFLERIQRDFLDLTLEVGDSYSDELLTGAGSTDVTSTLGTDFDVDLGARTGDFLVILEGPDSIRDVRYGPGVFLIQNIFSGLIVRLHDALTTAGTFRYGIRRKTPHEG
jgi:hypothetical protein